MVSEKCSSERGKFKRRSKTSLTWFTLLLLVGFLTKTMNAQEGGFRADDTVDVVQRRNSFKIARILDFVTKEEIKTLQKYKKLLQLKKRLALRQRRQKSFLEVPLEELRELKQSDFIDDMMQSVKRSRKFDYLRHHSFNRTRDIRRVQVVSSRQFARSSTRGNQLLLITEQLEDKKILSLEDLSGQVHDTIELVEGDQVRLVNSGVSKLLVKTGSQKIKIFGIKSKKNDRKRKKSKSKKRKRSKLPDQARNYSTDPSSLSRRGTSGRGSEYYSQLKFQFVEEKEVNFEDHGLDRDKLLLLEEFIDTTRKTSALVIVDHERKIRIYEKGNMTTLKNPRTNSTFVIGEFLHIDFKYPHIRYLNENNTYSFINVRDRMESKPCYITYQNVIDRAYGLNRLQDYWYLDDKNQVYYHSLDHRVCKFELKKKLGTEHKFDRIISLRNQIVLYSSSSLHIKIIKKPIDEPQNFNLVDASVKHLKQDPEHTLILLPRSRYDYSDNLYFYSPEAKRFSAVSTEEIISLSTPTAAEVIASDDKASYWFKYLMENKYILYILVFFLMLAFNFAVTMVTDRGDDQEDDKTKTGKMRKDYGLGKDEASYKTSKVKEMAEKAQRLAQSFEKLQGKRESLRRRVERTEEELMSGVEHRLRK